MRSTDVAASVAGDSTDEARRQLLALCAIPGIDRSFIARETRSRGAISDLLAGRSVERSVAAKRACRLIETARGTERARLAYVDEQLEHAAGVGATLITALDEEYPANLELVFNLPPLLFVRGRLSPEDARSVAVVGTRQASRRGLSRARAMATSLADEGVTVVSGLAHGIDAAAHEAALQTGGRTIAVIGTGITRTYPGENAALAERIAASGAIVSQFWPDSAPTRSSFPIGNVTMSGMSQGTLVIEAGSTSGAKMQARLALQHGKYAFLSRSLAIEEPWARSYLKRHPGRAIAVSAVDDVLRHLHPPERIEEIAEQRRQLVLSLDG